MTAHDAHRLAQRAAHRGQAEAAHHAAQNALRRVLRADQTRGKAERPGGGVDQQLVGLVGAGGKPPLAELVLDQPVGGGVIGDPQQALGEDHQGQTLRRGQGVFAQQGLYAADAAGPAADGADHVAGLLVNAGLALGGQGGGGQQGTGEIGVVRGVGGAERGGGHGTGGGMARHEWEKPPGRREEGQGSALDPLGPEAPNPILLDPTSTRVSLPVRASVVVRGRSRQGFS